MDNYTRIHCIGIGGIGMSALARLLMHEGKIVSGSDRTTSDITRALEQEGAKVYGTQEASNITDDIELVIYSGAVKKDNPERAEAEHRGLKQLNYFEALALAVNRYKLIAISGAHGKTTTTAMLADVFENAGKDPTVVVGSLRAATKSNYRAGKSEWAIVEACEYQRHFLNLQPSILVITNVEHEHVDYYPDLASVQDAFRTFALKVPALGAIICDPTNENIKPVIEGVQANIIDYRKYFDPMLELMQPGMHNLLNAAAALAVADFVGIPAQTANEALRNFKGTWRRFEYKGELNGAKVYDDYGHHPTEIRATLQGAREKHPEKKITLVFQPHTYTRTKELFPDFVDALSKADRVILAPIYAAREENNGYVSSQELVEKIKEINSRAEYFKTFDEIIDRIKQSASTEDVILVMGAGDITEVATRLTS
jgi:UDP-N-acetylmuramate--alanine ligase